MTIARPTLQDIAKKVGVTKMTVSRYFNDPNSVAAATRKKIAAVVEETGFIPNKVPAILSKSKSKVIGLVIPSFSNMVFSDLITSVERTAISRGYKVLISHSRYDINSEEQSVADFLGMQVDAIILCESIHTELTTKRLKKSGIPVAELVSIPADPIDIAIGVDHIELVASATRGLIEFGRKNIAYFGVRQDRRTMERQKGFEMALRARGMRPHIFTSVTPSNFKLGGELMKSALASEANVDAVICTNDDVALGALIACQQYRTEVPEDIAVIGYNGLNFCDAAVPTLCSLATPRGEIGRLAVEKIVEQIESGKLEQYVLDLTNTCKLREGGSVTSEEFDIINRQIASITK